MNIKFLLIIILLWGYKLSFSQLASPSLYNNKGQLKADTSLIINSEQLSKWRGVEKLLINWIIENVSYSEMASEYKITGLMIISFDIDSENTVDNFKQIRSLGGGLEQKVENCLKQFRLIDSLAPSEHNSKVTYYLALKFDLIDANKYIETNDAIPISKVNWSFIQH